MLQIFNLIEGYDAQGVKKGTSDARTLTLSMWVKSNKTGNMQVNLRDASAPKYLTATINLALKNDTDMAKIAPYEIEMRDALNESLADFSLNASACLQGQSLGEAHDIRVCSIEYIKGLEMTRAELMNLQPPFKYFDAPTFPLYKVDGSAAKAGVFGSVITGFLLVLFFIGRVEAKNIMAD